MKYLKVSLLLLIIHVSIINNSNAQSIDSITTQRTTDMKKILSLSDEQYSSVKNIYTTLLSSSNDLKTSDPNIEERNSRLKNIHEEYRTALKTILTITQWNTYEQECIIAQQKVEQYLQQQKIKYTLLNNQ